jgi:hypothetical protein
LRERLLASKMTEPAQEPAHKVKSITYDGRRVPIMLQVGWVAHL